MAASSRDEYVTINVPTEEVGRHLRRLIKGGKSPDEAAEEVVAAYRPAPLADLAWPTVRGEAHRIARQQDRRTEDQALGGAASERVAEKARLKLPQQTFRLGDGNQVEWGTATADQHEMRVTYQLARRDGIDLDIARHELAARLIREREDEGVKCLDEIDGWQSLPDWAELGGSVDLDDDGAADEDG